jgi:flagellar protein FlgJ
MKDVRTDGIAAASAYTDLQGLGRLREAARTDSPAAVTGVAQQFEALFVGMMLDSMRAATATLDSGLFDSNESDLYQQLFDREIAQKIAAGGGLGIASALQRQFGRLVDGAEQGAALDTPSSPPAAGAAVAPGAAPAVTATGAGPIAQAEFVNALLPHAERVAAELGVHPLGIIAQAALETGWGQRIPARADGGSSLNLFGIKAGAGWDGERARRATIEFDGGVAVRRAEDFRVYDDLSQAFDDYSRLLRNDPRYRDAVAAGADPARFADNLQAGGYATDPAYATKIRAILQSPTLRKVAETLGPPPAAGRT